MGQPTNPVPDGPPAPPTDGADAGRGREAIGSLADELLPTLIARLEASRLGELEVRQDGWRVRLRRHVGASDDVAGSAAGSTPSRRADRRSDRRADRPPAADRTATEGGSHGSGRPQSLRAERDRRQVTSPAVGYYLPRDGLTPGTQVRAGDVIGHVDVLGVRQDVAVPEGGILVSLAAEPGEAVEYGQVLARLEPARPDAEASRNEPEDPD